MKIKFLRQFLTVNNNKSILLPCAIRGLIQEDNIVIVLLGSNDKQTVDNLQGKNVYAFDDSSRELWKIAPCPEIDGEIYPYSDIYLNDKGELIAGTTMGTEYLVNLTDGSVTPYGSGRPW